MRKDIRYISMIVVVLISLSSCVTYNSDEDCANYDYGNCNTIEPTSGTLSIRLTSGPEHPSVPVTVYTGHYPDGTLYWQDTLTTSSYELSVDLNHYYSVTALYIKGADTILAIDGDEVKLSSTNVCDSVCWSVKDGRTDVRLE